MPDLSALHQLTEQVRPPDPERLVALAERRRRQTTVGVASGVAASLALALVISAHMDPVRDTSADPVGTPSPAASFPRLSASEIRQHPDAESSGTADYPSTASDVVARVWTVCLGDCSRDTEWLRGEQQSALEVSSDASGTGALYLLDGSEAISHAVDDDFLVHGQGGSPVLVDAEGQRRLLETGPLTTIEEIAGPPVYTRWGLGYVDLQWGTLHTVREPGWDWQGADDTWLWGTLWLVPNSTVLRQAALWRNPDGSFEVKVLPIPPSDGGSGMLRAGTPGTMAVVEHFTQPRVAHISTDYGQTWQVRRVPDDVESGGELPPDWTTWPQG